MVSEVRRRPRSLRAAVGLLTLVAFAAVGCASGDDDGEVQPLGGNDPSESVSASPSESESPPETAPLDGVGELRFTRIRSETSTGDDTADGALLAYIGYTEMSGRLFADPTSGTEDLRLYSTGQAFDEAAGYAAQLADDGKSLQGAVTIRPEVVGEPDGQLVVIEDCMDQSDVRVHFADGDSQDIDQEDWLDIHAEIQRTSGHGWRVATYQLDGRSRPCE